MANLNDFSEKIKEVIDELGIDYLLKQLPSDKKIYPMIAKERK